MRVRSISPILASYPESNHENAIRYLTLCRIETDAPSPAA